MATQIFVNIPVKNLEKIKEFFSKLGFSFNPQFTDEKAACMIINENACVMLLVENFFKAFTKKKLLMQSKQQNPLFAFRPATEQK